MRRDIDTPIALTLVGLYFALVLALLPRDAWTRALLSGTVVFGGIWLLAERLGRGRFHLLSVWAVACVGVAVLAAPTFPAMGDDVRHSTPVGFLGVLAAMLLWIARRWRPRRRSSQYVALLAAWGYGVAGALGLSLLASIPIVLSLLTGGRDTTPLLWVYPAYFTGMLAAATVYWLLQRIAHSGIGRFLIGALGGTCVYGAIAPVVAIVEGEPMQPAMMLTIATLAGFVVGPSVAIAMDDDEPVD